MQHKKERLFGQHKNGKILIERDIGRWDEI